MLFDTDGLNVQVSPFSEEHHLSKRVFECKSKIWYSCIVTKDKIAPSNKWHVRFLKLAFEIASWSKDRSTKVGAVIIGPDKDPRSFGYNGFPRDVNDSVDARHERPLKYAWTEHAEKNALANCARVGIPTKNCSIYITHFPCSNCSRMIIQSGIKEVVVDSASINNDFGQRWDEDLKISKEMLTEANVDIQFIDLNP